MSSTVPAMRARYATSAVIAMATAIAETQNSILAVPLAGTGRGKLPASLSTTQISRTLLMQMRIIITYRASVAPMQLLRAMERLDAGTKKARQAAET